MKIRLAILENDEGYLRRLVSVFETKYADKFEIHSFTDPDTAASSISEACIEMLIADDALKFDLSSLSKSCSFAYLTEMAGISEIRDKPAIFKYQKAEQIYKQILSIYSETRGSTVTLENGEISGNLIIFSSPCGGCGTSVMAAACARRFAASGRRTLYLNLEKFGSADVFFTGAGQFDMSDVIFAIKSGKINVQLKLESSVKQDKSGVFFYSCPKNALDMLEMNAGEIERLISALMLGGAYDVIVIDLDFSLKNEFIKIYELARSVIWVGDGTETSNVKICRACEALQMLEQGKGNSVLRRIKLIYNKFSNKTGKAAGNTGIPNIGGAPRYEHASVRQVLEQLSRMGMLDKVI